MYQEEHLDLKIQRSMLPSPKHSVSAMLNGGRWALGKQLQEEIDYFLARVFKNLVSERKLTIAAKLTVERTDCYLERNFRLGDQQIKWVNSYQKPSVPHSAHLFPFPLLYLSYSWNFFKAILKVTVQWSLLWHPPVYRHMVALFWCNHINEFMGAPRLEIWIILQGCIFYWHMAC